MWRALGRGALGLAGVLALVFVAGELSGWRVLATPAERWLAHKLERPVHLSRSTPDGFRLGLWRGIRLDAAALRIDAPTWAGAEPLFEAEQVSLRARWRDLIGWRQGEPLPLRALSAGRLSAHLLRNADGQANWQRPGAPADRAPTPASTQWPLRVGMLSARDGTLRFIDALSTADVTVRLSLADWRLQASATGSYRGLPVQGRLYTGSLQPWLADAERGEAPDAPDAALNPALNTALDLRVGRAHLVFDGQLQDPLRERRLLGRYTLAGPSLAAVGAPLGLTLPTTAAFEMAGGLAQQGPLWSTVVERASIGRSRLDGEFQYDTRRSPLPQLAGRLHASTLALADLGPAIGTPTADQARAVRAPGRVLPDRAFDLPALRAMNANVLLRLERLDFGTTALQAASSLNGQLTLRDGVLRLADLDARLAQGRIHGSIQLDGRRTPARWKVALDGRGLRLEQWLRAVQRPGQPPYAAGRLAATLRLTGEGRSTAELLASADGRMGLHWSQGRLSHLVVEAAGLDIAQGLGLLLRGDDALPVSCGLADLAVHDGRVQSRAFVVDTRDSRLWLEGSLSLADERLALLARVQPKDFSPLALRAPLHITGTLGQPVLALDKAALASRAVPAALLAMVHPLAALLPLLDAGEPGPTQDCPELLASLHSRPARAASPTAPP